MTIALGRGSAKGIAKLYEKHGPNPNSANERKMDLRNNAIGRAVGQEFRDFTGAKGEDSLTKVQAGARVQDTVLTRVVELADNGELCIACYGE